MNKTLLAGMLSISSLGVLAQGSPEKYAATITKDGLKKQLTVIAGEEMQGRETGTEGQRKAAAYIAARFEELGLKPAPGTDHYQQYYPIGYDTVTGAELTIDGKTYQLGKDFVNETNYNNNGSIKAKKIVFAGYGIGDPKYDDYEDKDVKDAVIVIFNGEPRQDGNSLILGTRGFSSWGAGLSKKLSFAKDKGVKAVLVVNFNMDTISAAFAKNTLRTRSGMMRTSEGMVNAAYISQGLARALVGETLFTEALAKAKKNEALNGLAQTKKAKISYGYTEQKISVNASNVAGYIEGTDKKDEYVVLTGHYDHLGMRNGKIYYGADDDGSGTCTVLEMAAAFAKAKAEGNGPRRTIVFMTVSGEEKGLWGSEWYSDHPLFPLEKTSVDLNTDMVGRIDTERMKEDSLNYVYVIGHDKLSSELQGINEAANNKYTGLVLDYKYDDPKDPNRIYYRSDHYNFARKGVPILFFYDGMLKADYHQP
ncbi:MAG: M28 family peptidase, partial [Bacteroidetes bacterium]|nr:M28 family peptidase [Bacteroidota bacterium]